MHASCFAKYYATSEGDQFAACPVCRTPFDETIDEERWNHLRTKLPHLRVVSLQAHSMSNRLREEEMFGRAPHPPGAPPEPPLSFVPICHPRTEQYRDHRGNLSFRFNLYRDYRMYDPTAYTI